MSLIQNSVPLGIKLSYDFEKGLGDAILCQKHEIKAARNYLADYS